MLKNLVVIFAILVFNIPQPTESIASDCKRLIKSLNEIVAEFDTIRAKANMLYMQCTFGGPDTQSLIKLSADLKNTTARAQKLDPKIPQNCRMAETNVADFMSLISNRCGESLGRAITVCDVDAQSIIKSNLSVAKKVEKLTTLTSTYFEHSK